MLGAKRNRKHVVHIWVVRCTSLSVTSGWPMYTVFSSSMGSILLATHGYVKAIVKTGNPRAIKPTINPLLFSVPPSDTSWSKLNALWHNSYCCSVLRKNKHSCRLAVRLFIDDVSNKEVIQRRMIRQNSIIALMIKTISTSETSSNFENFEFGEWTLFVTSDDQSTNS